MPFEAALNEMTDSAVTVVEELGILLIEPLHSTREADFQRLDDQVVVIRYEHPGVQKPAPVGDRLRKQIQKAVAIEVVAVDIAPLIAAAGDMPDGTWKLETKLMGHGETERARPEEVCPVWSFTIITAAARRRLVGQMGDPNLPRSYLDPAGNLNRIQELR